MFQSYEVADSVLVFIGWVEISDVGVVTQAKSQASQFAHSPAEKVFFADCFRLQSGIIRNRRGIVWFVWEPCQEQGSDVLLSGGWMDLGALEQRNESLANDRVDCYIRNWWSPLMTEVQCRPGGRWHQGTFAAKLTSIAMYYFYSLTENYRGMHKGGN